MLLVRSHEMQVASSLDANEAPVALADSALGRPLLLPNAGKTQAICKLNIKRGAVEIASHATASSVHLSGSLSNTWRPSHSNPLASGKPDSCHALRFKMLHIHRHILLIKQGDR